MTVELIKYSERPVSPFEHLDPREIIDRGLKIKRFEIISIEDVVRENAIVDEDHARQLSDSMSGERGQIQPISTRARLEREIIFQDVIDGFHRAEGKRMSKDKFVDSIIVYGCDDEELFDLRILAASSVKSIQFPRIGEWISRCFESSKWADSGLSVAQAFGIMVSDRATSYLTDLTPHELMELKAWGREKCAKWKRPVSSVHQILRVIANSDPEIVREVRSASGGHDRTSRINPARLTLVANSFPGERNYGTQRAVLDYIVEKGMYTDQAEVFVAEAAQLLNPGMKKVKIDEVIRTIDLSAMPEKLSSGKELKALRTEVLQLKEQLAKTQKESVAGWRYDEELRKNLSETELDILEGLFVKFKDLNTLSQLHKMPVHRVLFTAQSALLKRKLGTPKNQTLRLT